MKLIFSTATAIILGSLTVHAEETMVPVNIDNFIRAQMDENFRDVVKKTGGIGVVRHDREPIAIEDQFLIRMNRDTPHSQAIFDLTSPLTVTIPEADGRFLSFMMNNQDHYQQILTYEPGTYTFTQEEVGTRYIWMNIRIFVDPNDPDDLAKLHEIQDAIIIVQDDPGALELPNWDKESLVALNQAIATVTPWVPDNSGMFGTEDEVDPVRHFVSTAVGPGGNKPEDAIYLNRTPEKNDGTTAYTLTVGDVPVEAFWSISLYNKAGYFEAPAEHASLNSVTAQKNEDGTITVHFGGDETAPNYLRIMDGWNYMVRLYRPGAEILDGSWEFPREEEQ
ncbi:DUF1214 domain-containing protein [Ruegeria arenilitoris]|uniref:DUF1214 domain-containing protein n=1 Tax=Ruegeria arenilitoris TaxID=1173585 RepID=UPI001C2C14C3|nr:DUF1214 domain-containing protein [Ruegeria arenilitoris]